MKYEKNEITTISIELNCCFEECMEKKRVKIRDSHVRVS